ncbi:kunitz-type serine protease inhibitor 6-like [Condylostylus longicornis]|uniref:kunitz-type serine protease inhibitor 6-like n=1 Tax=Condylostylus longicornis TaxID=2530218 RepID=UPI00244E3685|nr:kunitz-type serine protease inhibitor 6-like [Condylostylus longicornis]
MMKFLLSLFFISSIYLLEINAKTEKCNEAHAYNDGPCRANVPLWTFNLRTNECEKFKYHGCGGNRNKFASREECEKELPNRLLFPRHPPYRNSLHSSVKMEIINKIIIFTIILNCINEINTNEISGFTPRTEELQQWREEYCNLPKEEGNCVFYYMPSYYYNKGSGTCEEFAYGGCNGNRNRFPSKEICEKTCDQNAISYRLSNSI